MSGNKTDDILVVLIMYTNYESGLTIFSLTNLFKKKIYTYFLCKQLLYENIRQFFSPIRSFSETKQNKLYSFLPISQILRRRSGWKFINISSYKYDISSHFSCWHVNGVGSRHLTWVTSNWNLYCFNTQHPNSASKDVMLGVCWNAISYFSLFNGFGSSKR